MNFYMAHGGTNFGTGAGANYDPPAALSGGRYEPTVTSYDYDAALDERGAPTEKFHAFRDVIARFRAVPALEDFDEPLLPAAATAPAGALVPLADVLDAVDSGTLRPRLATGHAATVASPYPLGFEELGLDHGIVRYRSTLPGPRREYDLTIDGLADRAQLLVGGVPAHVFERNDQEPYPLAVPAEGLEIELVVESMGRVNYGRLTGERKGITGAILHERQEVHGWTMTPLPLPELPDLDAVRGSAAPGRDVPATAAFHSFHFTADSPADTFLDTWGWGKGYAWVNGFCLGRYWNAGPHETLYVPSPVVRAGGNEVVLLELDAAGPAPALVESARLGAVEPAGA
ncbi:beta-galactosidase [Zafaria sp. Z1313]|uniref:beta-galactosidase n=1 Tax=Zafaria sp. Z1313 TaxID=3423202 RepID=UPI003D301ABB